MAGQPGQPIPERDYPFMTSTQMGGGGAQLEVDKCGQGRGKGSKSL